jgi:hypothetical protein
MLSVVAHFKSNLHRLCSLIDVAQSHMLRGILSVDVFEEAKANQINVIFSIHIDIRLYKYINHGGAQFLICLILPRECDSC